MTWNVDLLPEAKDDLKKLDGSQRRLVQRAIEKVLRNPLPANEGGYGKPLGNLIDTDLAGCCKIKLKNAGLRIVYKIIRTDKEMLIIVIGARADSAVYNDAQKRIKKYNL
ncbi:MAG: type II toxin-antitoxin system RelE/ParE family toxin [Peptococcaceae bacterium]|nr:type II toxin-antitoxin system RelE/ParE family toxin [Peptococcaceae bacterium]